MLLLTPCMPNVLVITKLVLRLEAWSLEYNHLHVAGAIDLH